MTKKTITSQELILQEQNQELANYQNLGGHIKLTAIKQLEQEIHTMPWADRISQVIAMLNELRNLTSNQNETITLSDFKVSLENISLKGQISSLLLLYYSNPQRNIVSLFDKFEELDFIDTIKIQSYERGEDGKFSFVLEANVIANGTE